VLIKLASTSLIKIYRLLFCYLTVSLISSLGALTIPYGTKAYGDFYFSCETARIVIAAFVLVEIYSLALENTPALASFGRSAVGYLLGAAAIIPVLGLFFGTNPSSAPHPYLHSYLLFEQTMDGTMAAFLILISMFMAWFPVRLRRNVIIYIWGFIAWNLTRTANVHFANQFNKNLFVLHIVNSASMTVAAACLLFWLVMFRREGEARTAVVGHLWNRDEADRLTRQLDAINDNLTRLRRK
jgi:hypothetical protein